MQSSGKLSLNEQTEIINFLNSLDTQFKVAFYSTIAVAAFLLLILIQTLLQFNIHLPLVLALIAGITIILIGSYWFFKLSRPKDYILGPPQQLSGILSYEFNRYTITVKINNQPVLVPAGWKEDR